MSMPKKESPLLRSSILGGIAGALLFHLSCNLLFWLFSFGLSLAEVLRFVLVQTAGPIILGVFVGVLCNRCRINSSFWVAMITMFLAVLTAFLASEYLGVQMSTGNVARNMIVYEITVLIAGFIVAWLLIGLIVTVRWIAKR